MLTSYVEGFSSISTPMVSYLVRSLESIAVPIKHEGHPTTASLRSQDLDLLMICNSRAMSCYRPPFAVK